MEPSALCCVFFLSHFCPIFTGRYKGGFLKVWFWRMCPRPGFRSEGTCEGTLVPVFVLGEHPNVPSFRFSFRGNIHQNHPFGKPPFYQPLKFEANPCLWRLWLGQFWSCCVCPCLLHFGCFGSWNATFIRFKRKMPNSRAHPCSVDFGREAPRF